MILTWYIFRLTFNNVIICAFVLVGIIWLSQSFKNIKLIMNKGAGILEFFILSAYSLPSWLLIAIPFSIFAGCMISYLKLHNDHEILIMKSAGISPLNISKPAILVAISASIILFILSHFVMPKTYKNFKMLQNEIRNSTPKLVIKDNIFVDLNNNQTIYISKINKNAELEEIFIQDKSDPKKIVEFFSKTGSLVIKDSITLSMQDGTRISTDLKGRSTILNFQVYDIIIKKENKKIEPRVIEYNEHDFFELLKKSKTASGNKGKLLAEAHSRNTIILMPLVFSFVVMVTLLKDSYSRKFSVYKKTLGIGLLVIIQTFVLVIKNSVHSNITFMPLMYVFPILILITCVALLSSNSKYFRFSFFHKKVCK